MPAPRRVESDELREEEVASLEELFRSAWRNKSSEFTEEDREHAFGGVHFLIEEGGEILAHAAVVPRELHVGEHRLTTGYVEAVATSPAHRRQGHASALMGAVGEYLDAGFPLGALSTGLASFYARFGWRVWDGPTFCRTERGLVRTEDDDGGVMVRMTPTSPALDLSASISCELRSGDVW